MLDAVSLQHHDSSSGLRGSRERSRASGTRKSEGGAKTPFCRLECLDVALIPWECCFAFSLFIQVFIQEPVMHCTGSP